MGSEWWNFGNCYEEVIDIICVNCVYDALECDEVTRKKCKKRERIKTVRKISRKAGAFPDAISEPFKWIN